MRAVKALILALLVLLLQSFFAARVLAFELTEKVGHASSQHLAAYFAPGFNVSAAGLKSMQQARSLCNQACNDINRGAFPEAEEKLRNSLLLEPSLVSAHSNLGLVFNKTGRAQQAIKHLIYALSREPGSAAPLLSLAASYQLLGDLSQACILYKRYLAQFPNAADRALVQDICQHLQSEQNGACAKEKESHPGESSTWSKSLLRVYIHDASRLAGFKENYNDLLKDSFLAWSEPGLLSFEFVQDARLADIEVRWSDNPSALSSIGESGEAVLKNQGPSLVHASITVFTHRPGAQNTMSDSEIKALCLHEIGHALGLISHSKSPEDVMYCTVTSRSKPSSSDFHRLKSLYQ